MNLRKGKRTAFKQALDVLTKDREKRHRQRNRCSSLRPETDNTSMTGTHSPEPEPTPNPSLTPPWTPSALPSISNRCNTKLFEVFHSIFRAYENSLISQWELTDLTFSRSVDISTNAPLVEFVAKTQTRNTMRLLAVACSQSDALVDLIVDIGKFLLCERECPASTIVYIDTTACRPHVPPDLKETAMRFILSLPVKARRHLILE